MFLFSFSHQLKLQGVVRTSLEGFLLRLEGGRGPVSVSKETYNYMILFQGGLDLLYPSLDPRMKKETLPGPCKRITHLTTR